MKLLGQAVKPKRWQILGKIKPKGLELQFLRKRWTRSRLQESASKTSEFELKDSTPAHKL